MFLQKKIRDVWSSITQKRSNFAKSLIKAATGTFGVQIASVGLTFLTSLVLARLLETKGFGIFTYAMAWATLLSIPATLGLDKLLIRQVSVFSVSSDWGLLKGILSWANGFVLLVSLGLAAFAAIVAWLVYHSSSPLTVWSIWVALISLPINSLRCIRVGAMQGFNKIVLAMFPELLISPILVLGALSIWQWMQGQDNSVLWILGIRIVAITISFILGAIWLYQAVPQQVKKADAEYQPLIWFKSSLPFMFLGVTEIINTQGDILMLGAIKGVEVVGVYGVVSKISIVVIFIQGAVNSVLAPIIASFYVENKVKQLQQLVAKSTQIVLLFSLAISIILILFGKFILSFFGSDFVIGYESLIILIFGQFINAALGPVGLLLNMTGYEKLTAISLGGSVILNIFLNALLIPIFSINGAAIATATSIIAANLVNMFLVNYKLKILLIPFNVKNTKD